LQSGDFVTRTVDAGLCFLADEPEDLAQVVVRATASAAVADRVDVDDEQVPVDGVGVEVVLGEVDEFQAGVVHLVRLRRHTSDVVQASLVRSSTYVPGSSSIRWWSTPRTPATLCRRLGAPGFSSLVRATRYSTSRSPAGGSLSMQTHPDLGGLHVRDVLVDALDEFLDVDGIARHLAFRERATSGVGPADVGFLGYLALDTEFHGQIEFVDEFAEPLREASPSSLRASSMPASRYRLASSSSSPSSSYAPAFRITGVR